MDWTKERWKTLQEAFGLWRLVAWMSISTVSGFIAEFLQWLAGHYVEMGALATIPTWEISIIVGVFVALTIASVFLLEYATRLRKDKEPKIAFLELDIYDDSGEQYIRTRIQNTSLVDIEGIKARLESLSDTAGTFQLGEELDINGDPRRLDLPIQLFTQERLKERIANGEKFARPFNLTAGEKRYIEVFQATNVMSRGIHIYDAAYRRDLIPLDDAKFECSIHGAGVPLVFFVEYVAITDSADAYKVSLTDNDGMLIDEKTFRAEQ